MQSHMVRESSPFLLGFTEILIADVQNEEKMQNRFSANSGAKQVERASHNQISYKVNANQSTR